MNKKTFKIRLFCFLALVLILPMFLYSAVLAISSTPTPKSSSSTPTGIEDPEITLPAKINLQKIKDIRDEVTKKVQEKLDQIKESGTIRAYVGEIQSVDSLSIKVQTRNAIREVSVDKDSKIIGASREKLEPTDLKAGQTIIAMGSTNTEGKMLAKRIVVIPEVKTVVVRQAVFGKVSKIDKPKQILSIVNFQKTENNFQIKVALDTKITKKVDGKMQTVKFDDIEIEDRVISVGRWDEASSTLTAKIVHVIPGLAKGQNKITPKTPTPTSTE